MKFSIPAYVHASDEILLPSEVFVSLLRAYAISESELTFNRSWYGIQQFEQVSYFQNQVCEVSVLPVEIQYLSSLLNFR